MNDTANNIITAIIFAILFYLAYRKPRGYKNGRTALHTADIHSVDEPQDDTAPEEREGNTFEGFREVPGRVQGDPHEEGQRGCDRLTNTLILLITALMAATTLVYTIKLLR
jgi:hypothetical protein